MSTNKEINLKLAQDYLEAFCKLSDLHKKINSNAHPNFPSLFTEGLIKYIFNLTDATRSEKGGDFKLNLNGKVVYFEVKGTSSDKGTTTIGKSKAKFIIWIYMTTEKKPNKIGINLISCDCKKFKKNKRSNITLSNLKPEELLKPTAIRNISMIDKDKISKDLIEKIK